jgi:hypothetical protein
MKTASTLSHLGLQDAPQRQGDSSQMPGGWAGSVVQTNNDGVFVLLPQAKWDKQKVLIEELQEMMATDSKKLKRKQLEQFWGVLIHVVQTYHTMKPCLMGLHMTIDIWRPNQDKEGWRIADSAANTVSVKDEDGGGWNSVSIDLIVPLYMEAVTRFGLDLEALLARLCRAKAPPLRSVRCNISSNLLYSFANASGPAFGGSAQISDETGYQYGQWITQVTEEETLNWRELGRFGWRQGVQGI